MTRSRVLVVDDEPGLVRALAINLRAHGWEVATGVDGAQALDLAASWHPDVVLLDLGLPDIPGLDVIAGIRGWSRVPIVVLSARQHGEDKVDALDAGADDYVTKPFAMNELLARLRAAVRRAAPGDAAEAVVEAGDLVGHGQLLQLFAGCLHDEQDPSFLPFGLDQSRRFLGLPGRFCD